MHLGCTYAPTRAARLCGKAADLVLLAPGRPDNHAILEINVTATQETTSQAIHLLHQASKALDQTHLMVVALTTLLDQVEDSLMEHDLAGQAYAMRACVERLHEQVLEPTVEAGKFCREHIRLQAQNA